VSGLSGPVKGWVCTSVAAAVEAVAGAAESGEGTGQDFGLRIIGALGAVHVPAELFLSTDGGGMMIAGFVDGSFVFRVEVHDA